MMSRKLKAAGGVHAAVDAILKSASSFAEVEEPNGARGSSPIEEVGAAGNGGELQQAVENPRNQKVQKVQPGTENYGDAQGVNGSLGSHGKSKSLGHLMGTVPRDASLQAPNQAQLLRQPNWIKCAGVAGSSWELEGDATTSGSPGKPQKFQEVAGSPGEVERVQENLRSHGELRKESERCRRTVPVLGVAQVLQPTEKPFQEPSCLRMNQTLNWAQCSQPADCLTPPLQLGRAVSASHLHPIAPFARMGLVAPATQLGPIARTAHLHEMTKPRIVRAF